MVTNEQVKNLEIDGFATLPYPSDLRTAVEAAVKSWQYFCALPKDVKQRFTYADGKRFSGAGYEVKENPGATLDLKENFHMTLEQTARFEEVALDVETATQNSSALAFISQAEHLVEKIEPLIIGFAEALEIACHLNNFTEEVLAGRDGWIFRYIHYFGDRQPADQIAAAHPDKSGFTLHLYESAPGLEYLDFHQDENRRENWKEMPVSEGETVIIPGLQLQYKSRSYLRALWHRVVATERTAKTGRYSIVCFVPFVNTPAYNKSGKGRTQDLKSGFNYFMPHESFEKLFV